MEKYVCEENMCAGCMACKDVCVTDAISVVDSVTHYNAVIDEEKCIECGRCKTVCQQESPKELLKPLSWYQGWSVNEEIRSASSSGGLAAEIEKRFIENGGIVCSCVFEAGSFIFRFARTVEETKDYRGSKYVKSDPSGVYREIKALLAKGERVLFLGLPCQAASLRNYCEGQGLYVIDVICHGTPSPVVLERFLNSYGVDIQKVKELSFRDSNKFVVRTDGKKYSILNAKDYYMFGFLNSLSYTDNCYQCRYAQLSRVSDLTLGDAWGSDLPSDIRKKGVSIALCQTDKGKELLDNNNLALRKIDLDKVVRVNTQLDHPSELPANRVEFLKGIIDNKKYTSIIRKLYPKRYYKTLIKTMLYKIGLYPFNKGS